MTHSPDLNHKVRSWFAGGEGEGVAAKKTELQEDRTGSASIKDKTK